MKNAFYFILEALFILEIFKFLFELFDHVEKTASLEHGTIIETGITCKKIQKQPQDVFCKKSFLRNFAKCTGKHLCQDLFFNKVAGAACNFIKKETLAQVFSCEFCETSKNTFFTECLGDCF